MTREELQYQLDIVIYESQQAEPCYSYEDKVESEQKILAHDQAQREEIARLREALGTCVECIEVQNMNSWVLEELEGEPTVENAIAQGFWCQMSVNARQQAQAALAKEATRD